MKHPRILCALLALCLCLQCGGMTAGAEGLGDLFKKKEEQSAPAIIDKDAVINVIDYGADPSGKNDSTVAVQKALEEAQCNIGSVTLYFPKGEYHFYKDFALKRKYHLADTNTLDHPTKTIAILLENQKNLTLEGNGSLFIMHGNMMALAAANCENVRLHDFSWDYGVPTTSEMTVSALGQTKDGLPYTDFFIPDSMPFSISRNQKHILWESEKSPYTGQTYWSKEDSHKPSGTVVSFDPAAQQMQLLSTNEGPFGSKIKKIQRLDENRVRIIYRESRPLSQAEGVAYGLCSSGDPATAGALLWESKSISVDQVNVHYLHGTGWMNQMSQNLSFSHCNFIPRTGTGRFITSFSDALQFSGIRGNLTIEDCKFSHTAGEAVAIHSDLLRVKKELDDHTVILQYGIRRHGGYAQYHVGDQVLFYTRDSFGRDSQTVYTVTQVSNPSEEENNSRSTTVTFDKKLPASLEAQWQGEALWVAENITYAPEVSLKSNEFRCLPGTAVRCSTRNPVQIQDNAFFHVTGAAIKIEGNTAQAYQAGPVRNLSIRGNVFDQRGNSGESPSICIAPVLLPDTQEPVHKNISITGNTFYQQSPAAVEAALVNGLSVTENIQVVESEKELLSTQNCGKVTQKNNRTLTRSEPEYGLQSLSIPELNCQINTHSVQSQFLQADSSNNHITLDLQADSAIHRMVVYQNGEEKRIAAATGNQLSLDVNLSAGVNTLTIQTFSRTGQEEAPFLLNILRPGFKNATATDIQLNGISLADFSSDTYEYTIPVEEAHMQNYQIGVSLSDFDEMVNITMNGQLTNSAVASADLKKGLNTAIIAVRAENMVTTQYYTLYLKVPKADNSLLQSLTFSEGVALDQAFQPATLSYNGTANSYRCSLDIIAQEQDATIRIKINKKTYSSENNEWHGEISFFTGDKVIQVEVTAPNGETQNYTLDIKSQTSMTLTDVIFFIFAISIGCLTLFVILIRRKHRMGLMTLEEDI